MFILTTDNRMINVAHLSMIRRVYSGIEAYSPRDARCDNPCNVRHRREKTWVFYSVSFTTWEGLK